MTLKFKPALEQEYEKAKKFITDTGGVSLPTNKKERVSMLKTMWYFILMCWGFIVCLMIITAPIWVFIIWLVK